MQAAADGGQSDIDDGGVQRGSQRPQDKDPGEALEDRVDVIFCPWTLRLCHVASSLDTYRFLLDTIT